jgi:hypothetical protein
MITLIHHIPSSVHSIIPLVHNKQLSLHSIISPIYHHPYTSKHHPYTTTPTPLPLHYTPPPTHHQPYTTHHHPYTTHHQLYTTTLTLLLNTINTTNLSHITILILHNNNHVPHTTEYPRGAVVRAVVILACLVWIPLCTWVPVLRMRPYKPRSRVAVGVARKRTFTAKSHKF